MSHILIWKKLSPGSEFDVFRSLTYQEQLEIAFKMDGYNFGNRVWIQGLMAAIDTQENSYEFLPDEWTAEQINEEYDFIILSMANIFNREYKHYIQENAVNFANIRIPVYVIACGVQAKSYEDLDALIQAIGEPSKAFIRAIYQTGGQFALRGYFTKEFFDQLGFPEAVVTGCPSLYQLGRNLQIDDAKRSEIVPVFNGAVKPLRKLLQEYSESWFIDQDLYLRPLYEPFFAARADDLRWLTSFYCNYGSDIASLLAKDRVRLIPDICDWWNFLKDSGANFSFGTRIHGSIMPILAGIPATITAADSRTREMAEFFDIPYVLYDGRHVYNKQEFEKLYEQMDYSKFNAGYAQKFDAYESFLRKCGIVQKIPERNRYMSAIPHCDQIPAAVNCKDFARVQQNFKNKEALFETLRLVSDIKNKLKQRLK